MTILHDASLVILVPEAESMVGSYRQRYDPAAQAGMPAHITLLHPFSPRLADGEWQPDLGGYLDSFPRFSYELTALRRFPDVISLAPEPEAPFRRLISGLLGRYPGASFSQRTIPVPTPHLTIARGSQVNDLDEVENALRADISDQLPLQASAGEVTLMVFHSGSWSLQGTFPLGA